jgi:hypothetical protein
MNTNAKIRDRVIADTRRRAAEREARLQPARDKRAAEKQLRADMERALRGMIRLAEAAGIDDRIIVAEARAVIARIPSQDGSKAPALRKVLFAELKADLDKWGHIYPEPRTAIEKLTAIVEAMNDDR